MIRPLALAILCVTAMPAVAQQSGETIAPEAGTAPSMIEGLSPAASLSMQAREKGLPVEAQDWMVVAANPLASEAGARVLRAGGSAADAMIAVQTVLGLVEPQSSGLGGGAFLVWYDAETGELTTLDARETAPMAVTPRLFQTEAGEPMAFLDAVVGGRSVGTPGTPMLLAEAHRRWGKANWAGLFDEAITLAEEGFAVSPRLAGLIADDPAGLARFPATAAYFLPGGQPLAEGALLTNPEYAATLRRLAAEGAGAFYRGPIAEDIVRTVREAEGNPGVLSLADLANYRVVERPAVCADYRETQVCGMGPPSSGALTVGLILGALEPYDLAALGPESPESWRLIGDATRLAFADRGRYMADSDFVPVSVKGLLDPAYLAGRAALLRGDDALPEVSAGQPTYDHAMLGQDESLELPSTSHISIVDAEGNALSMTTTIENGFGSRLMTNGFLLNNELTDFSFRTHADGWPVANRVEPGKRPRSSMAPTIVLRDGKPILVIGSPGGATIIGYVAQALIAHLDWGMDVQQAVAMPHLVNSFGTFQIEAGTTAETLMQPLIDLGYKVDAVEMTSGLHAISLGDALRGGADPRREGIALGE